MLHFSQQCTTFLFSAIYSSTKKKPFFLQMTAANTFPDTFKDFFSNYEDDSVEIRGTILENKVIPDRNIPTRRYSVRQFRKHNSDITPKIRPLPLPVSCITLGDDSRDNFDTTVYNGRKRSVSLVSTHLVSLSPIQDRSFRSDSLYGPKLSLQKTPQPRKASMPNTGSIRMRPTLSEIRKLKVDRTKQHITDNNNNNDHDNDNNNNDLNIDDDVEYYRLRSFSITAHGDLANLGDFVKSRRSKSIGSVSSVNSCLSRLSDSRRPIQSTSPKLGNKEDGNVPSYKVGILGASGVGKTSITYQFTTSEYICAYDTSLDDEFGQKTVSVMLNGQETELDITDLPASEISVESFCASYNVDIFVVVYSIVDSMSFKAAEDIVLYLWKQDYMSSKAVILVGNKIDLERKREVPVSIGRKLANSVGCKFIETSSGLDHNVDQLLVGILAQIKLNPKRIKNFLSDKKKQFSPTLLINRRFLRQIFGFKRKSSSCENLFVL